MSQPLKSRPLKLKFSFLKKLFFTNVYFSLEFGSQVKSIRVHLKNHRISQIVKRSFEDPLCLTRIHFEMRQEECLNRHRGSWSRSKRQNQSPEMTNYHFFEIANSLFSYIFNFSCLHGDSILCPLAPCRQVSRPTYPLDQDPPHHFKNIWIDMHARSVKLQEHMRGHHSI